jgi:uncharacterized protein YutE (UPF0331/DUF86 family)
MTIDAELITRKLLLMTSDLSRLRQTADAGVEAFLADAVMQGATERVLERVIGRMIDVNYHVLTETGEAPPSDYHASFIRLGEIGILDPSFAARIARAAGLRNRLVHEYQEIDPRKVFEALLVALKDLPVYLARVKSILSEG